LIQKTEGKTTFILKDAQYMKANLYKKIIIATASTLILAYCLFITLHNGRNEMAEESQVYCESNKNIITSNLANTKPISNDYNKAYNNFFKDNTRSAKKELLRRLENVDEPERLRCYLNILTNGTTDTIIDRYDQEHVSEIIRKIQIMARTNDAAYVFLKESVQPGYWKTHRIWRREPSNDGYNYTLTEECIGALAFTARPEARQIILSLTDVDDLQYLAATAGILVESMWITETIQSNRLSWFESHRGDQRYKILDDWMRNSEEGKKWMSWLADVHRGRIEQKKAEGNILENP
jgi:hypothetical protein